MDGTSRGRYNTAQQAVIERLRKPRLTSDVYADHGFIINRSDAPSTSGMRYATCSTLKPKRVNFSTKAHRTSALFSSGKPLIPPISSLALEPKTPSFGENHEQTSKQQSSVIEEGKAKNLPQKPLNIAVMNGEIETVVELLNSGADPEEKDGYYGNTGIHWAVKANNIEILELYRERGFNMSVTDDFGWPPISAAAIGCRSESLVWLLKKGADVNTEDCWKQTPLHKAVFKGHVTAAKLLLSYGAYPHCKDVKNHTPLTVAVVKDHIEMVKLLFEHGADLEHTDSWGRNLLHTAKSFPLLKWLIEHNLDINRKDDWDRTPLHDAVQASNLQNAAFLLEKGADIDAQDRNGCTPLYQAAKTGKTEFVRLFLGKGADPKCMAKDGSTAVEVTSDETIKNLLLHKKGYSGRNGPKAHNL